MKRHFGSIALAAILGACSNPPPPPADADANVLIGDALPPDGRAPPDARADSGEFGSDRPTADADLDAEPSDRELDSGPGDTGGPDAGELCNALATATLTATQAAAEAAQFDGQVVDVVGTATTADVVCTGGPCAPNDPCCMHCTAEVSIERMVALAASTCAPRVGCEGDQCTLVCTPPLLGLRQTFRGVLRAGTTTVTLELARVLP